MVQRPQTILQSDDCSVIYCIPCLVLHVCIHVTYFLLSNGFPSSCLRYLTNNCVQSCTLPIIYNEELLHKQLVWADMQQLTICNKILIDVPINIERSCHIIFREKKNQNIIKKIGFNELCHNVGAASHILMQHFYINNQMTLNLKDDNNRFSTCATVNGQPPPTCIIELLPTKNVLLLIAQTTDSSPVNSVTRMVMLQSDICTLRQGYIMQY